jgi:uncharacterized repeat protein (TIGR01451 family)
MRHFILVFVLGLAFAPAAGAATADLALSASAPGVIAIGDSVTATAIVRNRGPANAPAVKLTDTLAGPLTVLSATTTRGSCSIAGAVVTCSLGSVRKSSSIRIDVTAQGLAAGDLRNEFSVRSNRRPDPRLANNTAQTLTSIPRTECTITGTAGTDRLIGTAGDDVICGLGGNDVLLGLGGSDTLYGGAGKDRLAGGPGDDRLRGERGADTVTFASARTGVQVNLAPGTATGQGADSLRGLERAVGSRYRDVLRGTRGRNVLTGGGGADRLYGGAGRDNLWGRAGNDYLGGGRGRDVLYGGKGRDRCRSGRAIGC